jgi:hypothetical protein
MSKRGVLFNTSMSRIFKMLFSLETRRITERPKGLGRLGARVENRPLIEVAIKGVTIRSNPMDLWK